MPKGRARALVLEEPRRLVTRELPLPEVDDAGALLRVEACGLCGTDHEQYAGVLPAGFAFVPGHETVGVLEAVGAGLAERWGVAPGDRVAVEVFQSCRACPECEAGTYQRCRRHGLGDMYGYVPVDRDPGLWGGYATHHYLTADTMLHRVPPGLEPVKATLFNPLGAGVRWGVTVPGTRAGDVVVVMGPGVRGLSALVAARDAGAGFVMVTGFGANDASRLALCTRFGADVVVDAAAADPAGELKRATGGLADVVVNVTAKAPGALAQAIGLARPGGTIVMAGTCGFDHAPVVQPDLIVLKELRVLGALGVDAPAYARALELLADDRFPWDQIPRRVADLDGAEDLVRTMAGEGDGPPPVHGVIVP